MNAFADRTPGRLKLTLEVAEGTLNRSAEVLGTITPISKKVEKWANNMRNKEYSTAAYEQAVLSAGEAGSPETLDVGVFKGFPRLSLTMETSITVENLNVLVPELLDKLKVVEEKKPVSNVTTNILRIRELIAQARSVAKKVTLPLLLLVVAAHPRTLVFDLLLPAPTGFPYAGPGVHEVQRSVVGGGPTPQQRGGAEDRDIDQPLHQGGPGQRSHRGPLHPVPGRPKCESECRKEAGLTGKKQTAGMRSGNIWESLQC